MSNDDQKILQNYERWESGGLPSDDVAWAVSNKRFEMRYPYRGGAQVSDAVKQASTIVITRAAAAGHYVIQADLSVSSSHKDEIINSVTRKAATENKQPMG